MNTQTINRTQVSADQDNAEGLPPVHPDLINQLVEQLDLGDGAALDSQCGDVIAMARVLGIVFVHHETVVLTQHGRKLARASRSERRSFWKKSLLRIPAFREIVAFLEAEPSKMAAPSVVLRRVQNAFQEANREFFDTLLSWGVFSGILSVDPQTQCLCLLQNFTWENRTWAL